MVDGDILLNKQGAVIGDCGHSPDVNAQHLAELAGTAGRMAERDAEQSGGGNGSL